MKRSIGNKFPGIVALGVALTPGIANALGFGDLLLQSRIGEPLLAEVPVTAGPGESPQAACFSLAPLPGADFPVVTAAKTKLIRRGQGHVLQITGNQPLTEPIIAISLRASCGQDLQRDYVLMPDAPLSFADAGGATLAPASASATIGAAESSASADEAKRKAAPPRPDRLAAQQTQRAAQKRAAPRETTAQPSDDAPANVPSPRKTKIAPAPRQLPEAGVETPVTASPKPAKPVAPPAANRNDRLLLSVAPDELLPAARRPLAPNTQAEAGERIQRLENTLRQLTLEMEKMDAALTLATQTIEAQNKLQMLQAHQQQATPPAPATPAVAVPSTVTPVAATTNSGSNWLELILSAVLGGGLAVGLAHYLSRRRSPQAAAEAPLRMASGYRAEFPVEEPASPPATATPQSPAAEPVVIDIGLARHPVPSATEVREFNPEDDRAVLDLAEIMLSFGRLRGAAETLAEHIDKNSPGNILPWSMLLDLYRRSQLQAEFETLAAQMSRKFNAQIPAWDDAANPQAGLKSLEDYTHITWRISHDWGTASCMAYLHELTHDTRAGQRSGFPLEVVEEIALLMQILETAYGLPRQP